MSHVLPPVGGGGGARVPLTVSGSPFADLAALEAWSQANPTELLNNDENVSAALVGTSPNFITYEWIGQNQVYSANSWSRQSDLTPDQESAVDSIVNLPDNSVPKAVGGELLDGDAIVDPTSSEWTFDRTINVPVSSVRFDKAWTLSSSGASISARDDAIDTVYRAQLDDIMAIDKPEVISNRLMTGLFEVQPIDTDTLVDPVDATVVIPAVAQALNLGEAEDGQTISFVDLKLTPASAKTNITIRLTLNGQIFAEFFYPTAVLYEAPDIYRFHYNPPVDVRVGDNLLVNTFSSDGPMVFLGRADTQVKWQRVDLVLWDYDKIQSKEDLSKAPNQYLLVNNEYTTNAAQTSGIVVNYEPTTITDTATNFTGSIGTAGGVSGTCQTIGSGIFSSGDIVQVSGSRFNDFFFEVNSHVGTTLEIRGVDGSANVEEFTKTDFLYELEQATITKVNVSVLRSNSDGEWYKGKGSVTPIVYKRVVDLDDLENIRSYATINKFDRIGSTLESFGNVQIDATRSEITNIVVAAVKSNTGSSSHSFRIVYSGPNAVHDGEIYYTGTLNSTTQGLNLITMTPTATPIPNESDVVLESQGNRNFGARADHVSTMITYQEKP